MTAAAPGPAASGAPAAPATAAAAFGPRLRQAESYAAFLAGDGIQRGLIGPGERDVLWERHLLNSCALVPLLPPDARVADLGSGAGLPGVPLALARPDLRLLLVEPLERRARFLIEVLERLELANARVVRHRAAAGRPLPGEPPVDAVVARALAPLPKLVGWSMPLLRPGGNLLALKGARADLEVTAAQESGVSEPMEVLRTSYCGHSATVVRVRRPAGPGTAVTRRERKGSTR